MTHTVEDIIKKLELRPHPEGGYFRETYRSSGTIGEKELGDNYKGERNYSTCIYFLLTSDSFSAFHRIKQDEIWHFYEGSSIELHTISENGDHKTHKIGMDLGMGDKPQLVVSGGDWFAAKVINKDSYSLVGCTVAPGFDFYDFELSKRDDLIKRFPQHKDLITQFTHN